MHTHIYAASVFHPFQYMYANSSAALMRHRSLVRTMVDPNYLNVRLPKQLIAQVDRIVDRKALGFRSRAEFIADAIRRRLEEILELERIATRRK